MLPLRNKLPNSQHNDGVIKHCTRLCPSCYLCECVLMKRWFWGEPSTPLVTWQQKHMPSACAGLPASAVCPPLCQFCHWDGAWKGETVWHSEGLRITGCLIITSSCQERVDTSLTISTENQRHSGERGEIDSLLSYRYLVWYFSDIYSD